MPDSTNNHGGSWDLTIPAGDDTVDIVRDVGTLGVEVDVALSEAFVGMIDADAGDGDYSGATVPLSLYGTGRPDTENITAPTGSTYTCTTPDADGNFGAAVWRYYGTDWRCVDGKTATYRLDAKYFGSAVSSGTFYFRRSVHGGLAIRAETFRLTNDISNSGSGSTGHQCFKDLPVGWRPVIGSTQWGRLINGSSGYSGVGRFWRGYLHITNGTTAVASWIHNFDYSSNIDWGSEPGVWPTEPCGDVLTRELLLADIEDNPELAEQLKAELEALRSEDG